MHVVRAFPDEELIKSLQTGRDRDEAIRFIYKNHFSSLTAFVMNNNGSLEDAEDIFQEVVVNFISLVQLNKFRGESSFKTFLYSMNRFGWLNELKRRSKAGARELKYDKRQFGKTGHFLVEKKHADLPDSWNN
ncbi:MAG: sigma factor [Ferruginibacter sp.]